MFKETESSRPVELFGDVENLLEWNKKKLKKYRDETRWHNQFRCMVYDVIDETPYRILFDARMGAPNAPVKQLVSMMIIKELFRWSDSQLFEQFEFNVLVRRAIGIDTLTEDIPVPSTYYLFRKRIYEHGKETGEELLEETFSQITEAQVREFKVDGRRIRMDSKLLGSNIGWYSRYELVHKSFEMFYRGLTKSDKRFLQTRYRTEISRLLGEEAEKVVYRHNRDEVNERLVRLGELLYRVIRHYKGKKEESFRVLERVFENQYEVNEEEKIILRPKEKIPPDSVQSPHDPDCTYRGKSGKKVKGYHANVTETCGEDLHLITDIRIEAASCGEARFYKEAVEGSERVTGQRVEHVHADGAYYSESNSRYSEERDLDFVVTGIKGSEPRYLIHETHEGYVAVDRESGSMYELHKAETYKDSGEARYYIRTDSGRKYFSSVAIYTALQRQKLISRPERDLQIRNNVEATIGHFAYGLLNHKTPYRRKQKQQMWAYCRAMAINIKRIAGYVCPKRPFEEQKAALCAQKVQNTVPSTPCFFIFSSMGRHLSNFYGFFQSNLPIYPKIPVFIQL